MKRLGLSLVLVLACLAPAVSRSDQPWVVEAVVENYLDTQGPAEPMQWARVEYSEGQPSVTLKEIRDPKTGIVYRQILSASQPRRAVLVGGVSSGRWVSLPITVSPSSPGVTTPGANFTLVIGADPECSYETRQKISMTHDRLRAKLDAYFIARKLVEKNVCRNDANRLRVLRYYVERSCDLSRSHPAIRIDQDALSLLRLQHQPELTALANRAEDRCRYEKSGAI